MNILTLKGGSQNDVLTAMAERLTAALVVRGATARVVAVDHQTVVATAAEALAEGGFDTVLSFAAFGAEISNPQGLSLYDYFGVRFIGWTVDHPAFHYERAISPITRRYAVLANPSQFDFMDAVGVKAVKVPLLAGADDLSARAEPFAKRPIPLLLAASWIGHPKRWWASAPGTPVAAIAEAVIEGLDGDPEADLFAAYQGALQRLGYDLPFDQNMARVLAEILLYVRQRDRIRLVEAIAEAGLPLTLCGDGWEALPHLKLPRLQSRPFDALGWLYGACKVVVNLNAGNGACERAMAAASAGAATISDANPLLEAALPDALALYNRTDPARAAQAIGDLLESDAAEAVAAAGAARVWREHLWVNRAEALMAAIHAAEGWV
jgi:hypothetical protein